MKRLIFSLIFLLCLNLINAGEIKKIDLENSNRLTIDISVKDGIEFSILGNRHVITIDKITKKGVDLEIFLFIDNDQQVSYITIINNSTLKLDLNEDGKGDLYVGFDRFLSSNSARLIFFRPINQADILQNNDNELKEPPEVMNGKLIKYNFLTWYLPVVLIILIIILSFILIYSKQKEKNKNKNQKNLNK